MEEDGGGWRGVEEDRIRKKETKTASERKGQHQVEASNASESRNNSPQPLS